MVILRLLVVLAMGIGLAACTSTPQKWENGTSAKNMAKPYGSIETGRGITPYGSIVIGIQR